MGADKLELSPEIVECLRTSGVLKNKEDFDSTGLSFNDSGNVIFNGYDEEGKKSCSVTLDKYNDIKKESVFKIEEVEELAGIRKSKAFKYKLIMIFAGIVFAAAFVLFIICLVFFYRFRG